jgi:hypothetical protein
MPLFYYEKEHPAIQVYDKLARRITEQGGSNE